MAQTIVGLDIGSYSVKVATISASFRSFSWTGYREYEIPHNVRDKPEQAAARMIRDFSHVTKPTNAAMVCAVPGGRVMTRFLTLPFSDPKRVDSVLGFELEGMLPVGVEDMVYSYQVTEPGTDRC